jgi:tetratricopeptide (TPR) repeat protein
VSKRSITGAAILAVLILFGNAFSQKYEAEDFIIKGIGLSQQRMYNEALEQYRMALRLDSACTAAYNNAGIIYLEIGQYELAERMFREVIRRDSLNAIAYQNLGNAYYYMGQYDQAVTAWRTALGDIPEPRQIPVLCVNIGNALFRSGDLVGAAGEFQEAINLDPGNAEVYVLLAQTYSDELYEERINLYRKAIAIDINCAPAYQAWGRDLYFKGTSGARESLYDVAIQRLSRRNYELVLLGIDKVKRASRLDSTNAAILTELAGMLESIGQTREASEAYEKVQELNARRLGTIDSTSRKD